MKSKQFRVLETINETEYQFDSDAFAEAMSNFVSNKRQTDKTYTKHKLMLEICDKGFTYDAVKKWKQGSNGPGSIDIVKSLAETMGIEYTSLLSPVERKEVTSQVNEYILNIYQECLSAVYRWTENMYGIKTGTGAKKPMMNWNRA